jgi:serine kinase of HPr protein (carbohydrate metabolism regulator)
VASGAGMLSSTMLTLLVVPVFYLVLDDAVLAFRRRLRRLFGRAEAVESAAGVGAHGRA